MSPLSRINTNLNITAPAEINVPLVRADHLEVANIFRVCFEVFLAITSGVCGSMFTQNVIPVVHYVFLGVSLISTVIFGILSYVNHKKCYYGKDNT